MKKFLLILLIVCPIICAAQTTPNLHLYIPSAHTLNWDILLNQNFSILDTFLGGGGLFNPATPGPIGGTTSSTGNFTNVTASGSLAANTVSAGGTTNTTIGSTGVTFPDGTVQSTKSTGSGSVTGGSCGTNQYAKSVGSNGAPTCAQVGYSQVSGAPTLATVATSGNYNDLSNKPTIPAAQVAANLANSSSTGVTGTLPASQVGSGYPYNNISSPPTIPSTPSGVGLGNVTNDAQTKAALVPNTVPTAAQILLGNAGGTAYAPVTLSGPVSVTSAGVTSVATLNQSTTGNAATATAINGNGTGNQVWGMNSGGSAQGWQTVAGGGSSSTPTPTYSVSCSSNCLYVATTGSDSNPGTQASPFATLQHAANVATADYTVIVSPGTYTSSSQITMSTNGTSGSPITFASSTLWGAKIVTSAAVGVYLAASYNVFEGFDVSASGTGTANLVKLSISTGHITAMWNKIHNMAAISCVSGGGIQVGSSSETETNYTVSQNVIYNIGLAPSAQCNQTHGIYLLASSSTVQNNQISNCGDLGIQIDGNGPSNNAVTNNTIFANWKGIVFDSGDGGSSTTTGNIVANNIIYGNSGVGIYDGSDGPVSGNTITHNLIYGNSPNTSWTTDTDVATVAANPLFVNYTGDVTGNYAIEDASPSTVSPAVAAGLSADCPSVDINGIARPSPCSIGAYDTGSTPLGSSNGGVSVAAVLGAINGQPITPSSISAGTLYSAAGTALPTCASGTKSERAVVSDATGPTYMGAYTSGGAITAEVICSYNGTTYAWLTH